MHTCLYAQLDQKKKSVTVSRNQHLGIQKFGILASESLIHTEDIYIQIGA